MFFILKIKAEDLTLLPGQILSPFEACQDEIIVSKEKYKGHQKEWDDFINQCHSQIYFSSESGLTKLDPLKEKIEYLDFATKLGEKILKNLKRSKEYAECSARCFKGEMVCDGGVICKERKKEIFTAMNSYTRRMRMELALSRGDSTFIDVNIRNVFSLDVDYRINKSLNNFEIGTPNPVGFSPLEEIEVKEAKRRLVKEKKDLEEEAQKKGIEKKSETFYNWMSVKMMEKMEEHQRNYRKLLYEEVPLFGVLSKPANHVGDRGLWSEDELSAGFLKLSKNAEEVQKTIERSLEHGKLEFTRINGEAIKNWLNSFIPGKTKDNELLYYLGMKKQVEELLNEDKKMCGIATSMFLRLQAKDTQNTSFTILGTFLGAPFLKGASTGASHLFRIGRALTGAEAGAVTGVSLASEYLGDSFIKYKEDIETAATKSGLNPELEGSALIDFTEIENSKGNLKLALIFGKNIGSTSWFVGRIVYNSLAKEMVKDFPEIKKIMMRKEVSIALRDQLVDKWLLFKLNLLVKKGVLKKVDAKKLQTESGNRILNQLAEELSQKNPDFFKKPENIETLLSIASSKIK